MRYSDRLIGAVSFADALDIDGREHLRLAAGLAENIGKRKAVHRRCKHTHTVCRDALDMARSVLNAAPEVAAADDYADLNAHLGAFVDRFADL